MINILDRAISAISPGWAVRRARSRSLLAYYEASRPDKQRKQRKSTLDYESTIHGAAKSLRDQARHFDENLDLAKGVLRVLVNNTVGANGIVFEPMPRTLSGEYHEEAARAILRAIKIWSRRPEVTRQFSWPMAQRLVARTRFRDGEAFAQRLLGTGPRLQHGGSIPYSLELFEPDLVPFDLVGQRQNRNIINGIEVNAWGKPVTYWVYKEHPGNLTPGSLRTSLTDLKPVSAERILHVASPERLHGRRGISIFASILKRLDDIADYESSERIAAKVAASMGFVIKRGSPEMYNATGGADERDWRMRPGVGFELEIGESVDMIGNNGRPNPELENYRSGQLRAMASGVGTTYSSAAKNFGGSYSSQRQELVEGYVDYGVLSDDFVARFIEPAMVDVISAALLAGEIRMFSDLDMDTVTDGLFISPQMPWIDPDKESKSWERLEQAGHASGPEIIRKRGRNPLEIFESEKRWRERWADAGLSITADPASSVSAAPEQENANAQEIQEVA